jgi:asparagine synthase (glutamine-hydrolysing)
MCGILGGINVERDVLTKTLPFLKHRGPDDSGEYFNEKIGLLHTRLSIQDLQSGHQPFYYKDLIIVLNGEIYNHIELRAKYCLVCKTNSDTETLLMLYHRFGTDILPELDGMFAFAIYNVRSRILTIVRDRAGKKPLYYFSKNGKFAFGSELNALKNVVSSGINYQNIHQYLRYNFTGSSTPYQDISELEAGCWISINADTLELKKKNWWAIMTFYQNQETGNFPDILNKLDNLLDKSVASRLFSSDLEVGAFLSGGIDSGLIVAMASKHVSKLKTFTVGFEGFYDESILARTVSERYNTEHIDIRIEFNDLANEVETILSNYGEPFGDSSAIPSFYVSREAKKYLTVILNGDGADEIFAGYRRYVPFAYYDIFKSPPFFQMVSGKLGYILPFPKDKHNYYNYVYRLLNLAGLPPLNCYLSATVDTFEGYENMLHCNGDPFTELHAFIENINKSRLSGLQKIMCIDFSFQLPNDLLVKMDIATMANSLEGRSPFLGKSILEFAPSLSDNVKIKGVKTKYILRELARRYLPETIITQPKRGFEVPLKNWTDTILKELVYDYLGGDTFSEEFVNKRFIKDLLDKKANVAPEKRAKMLWYMLALEIWYHRCYLSR